MEEGLEGLDETKVKDQFLHLLVLLLAYKEAAGERRGWQVSMHDGTVVSYKISLNSFKVLQDMRIRLGEELYICGKLVHDIIERHICLGKAFCMRLWTVVFLHRIVL